MAADPPLTTSPEFAGWTVRQLAERMNQLIETGRGDDEVCIHLDVTGMIPEPFQRRFYRHDWVPVDITAADPGEQFITINAQQARPGDLERNA